MKPLKKITIMLLSTTLILSSFTVHNIQANAASSEITNAVYAPTKLKTVYLTKQSYFQVNDIEMSIKNNTKKVYFTVNVYNGGKNAIDFRDYWVKVRSKSGSTYSPKIHPLDAKKSKIAPNVTEKIRFSVDINMKSNLSDLLFDIIKWDVYKPGFEIVLGTITMPANYSTIAPYGKSKVINYNDLKLKGLASSVQLVPTGNVVEASMSLTLENMGSGSAKLPQLAYYLKASNGNLYSLESDAETDMMIAPNSKRTIQLYTKLPKTNSKLTYQLLVTVPDSENSLETPLGYFETIQKADANVYTKPRATKTIQIKGVPISTRVTDIMMDSASEAQSITLFMKYKNDGKQAIAIPKYSYSLLSSSGSTYPMKSEEIKDELLPGMEVETTLSVSIPSSISIDKLKLMLQNPKEENKKNDYLVSVYELPTTAQTNNGSNTITYKNAEGYYSVSVKKKQRAPWDDMDLLNVEVDIKNVGLTDSNVPNLTGKLIINGKQIEDKNVQIIKPTNKLYLKPNESTTIVLSTKIPYSYQLSNVSVIISNVIKENMSSTVGRFALNGNQYDNLDVISAKDAIKLTESGRQSEFQIESASIYEGKETDLVYVDFKQTNLQTRIAVLPIMSSYFTTEDGTYIPATTEFVKDKVAANGTALIGAWGKLPKGVSKENLKFHVGEAITGAAFTTPEGKPDGLVKIKNYELPAFNSEAQLDLKNMNLKPFDFNVNYFSTSANDYDSVSFEVNYDLTEEDKYSNIANGKHKLVFEVNDGVRKYEKSFEIGKTASDGMAVGENQKISFTFDEKNAINIVYRGFTISLYDEVDGHRKLLGKKDVSSFTSVITIDKTDKKDNVDETKK